MNTYDENADSVQVVTNRGSDYAHFYSANGKIWDTIAARYTDETDPVYCAWRAAGYAVITMPSEAEMIEALHFFGLPCPMNMEEARAAKLAHINAACDAALRPLTGGYPASELLTFDKQETEARAYVADPASPTPLLSALSTGRGMELAELVGRVIAKADAFAAASGYVIGQRQALEDRLSAAETIEAVQAIDVNLSLPGMADSPVVPEVPVASDAEDVKA